MDGLFVYYSSAVTKTKHSCHTRFGTRLSLPFVGAVQFTMSRRGFDTFDDTRPDLSLPPPPGHDSNDDSNLMGGQDSSNSGITAPSSAPIRTPRTSTSGSSVARAAQRGVDATPRPSRLGRGDSTAMSEDNSFDLPVQSLRITDSVIQGLDVGSPIGRTRPSKHNAMTLREHEQVRLEACGSVA